MPFGDYKITHFDVSIAALPDRIAQSSAWLKRQFDARTDQVQAHFNRLLDALDEADLAPKAWVTQQLAQAGQPLQCSPLALGSATLAPGAAATLTATVANPTGLLAIGAWPGQSGHPAVACTGLQLNAGRAGATVTATYYNPTAAQAAINPTAQLLYTKT